MTKNTNTLKITMSEITQKAADLLLTKRCVCCSEIIDIFSATPMCESCFKDSENKDISDKFYIGNAISAIMAVYIYDGQIRKGLWSFKYKNKSETGIYMAKRIAEMLKKRQEYSDIDIVVSIPCFCLKNERQYNQSEFLAKRVALRLNLEYNPKILKKTVDRKSQTKCRTWRERYENVQNVFRVALPKQVERKTVLIIDDIITTGYTVETCAKLLKKAGAKKVLCAVAAKTPLFGKSKDALIKKSLDEDMKIIIQKKYIKIKNTKNIEKIYQRQRAFKKIENIIKK